MSRNRLENLIGISPVISKPNPDHPCEAILDPKWMLKVNHEIRNKAHRTPITNQEPFGKFDLRHNIMP